MVFTKTNFLQYQNCRESLWLLKNKPEHFRKGELSLFLEKLIKEGYEVEEYAKMLFPNGKNISSDATPAITKTIIEQGGNTYFQPSFVTSKVVFARVDMLERLADDTWHIYEVKSSSKVKKDHIQDACFQKHVLEENEYAVSKVSIIHLNSDYIKVGAIIPSDLLEVLEVTAEVNASYSTVVNEINAAVAFMSKERIDETQCSCKYKTRSNHCDSFEYFNPLIPDYSIYEIKGISAKKVETLINSNCLAIIDIPQEFDVNENQMAQVISAKKEEPTINKVNIKSSLDGLKFPLHFIDYETYASAIPKLDGLSPHKHLSFQVSIHTLQEDGTLTHFEYLLDEMKMPVDMLSKMQEFTGNTGTFVSWYASFEISRNKDLIHWLPQFTSYLTYINEHTFDLEPIFRTDYIDYRFHGSSSIKKVLPVLVPEFSYLELEVGDGTTALDTWGRLVFDPDFKEDKEKTKKDLLEYCKLDTLAMVRIYEFLKKLT